jgi:hypothetical protein
MFHLPCVLGSHSNPSFVAPQPSLVKVVALSLLEKKEKVNVPIETFFKNAPCF